MYSKTLHGRGAVTTQRASFDEVVLSDVFVLEMSTHGNLTLESSIAYWAMIRQAFSVGCKMFGQMIFPEESFLTNATFVRFDPCMPHFMSTHVSSIWKLHIAHIAFEYFSMWTRVCILCSGHIVIIRETLAHMCG